MTPDTDTLDRERQQLEAACAVDPADFSQRCRLGDICQQLGRPVDAARHFAAAAGQRPEEAGPRYQLGLALQRMGRADDAILAYRAALAVDAGHIESNLGLASLYAGRRDAAAALEHYDAALAADPSCHRAFLGKGNVLLAAGDLDTARDAFDRAMRAGAPAGVRFLRDLALPVIAGSAAEYRAARDAFEAALSALDADCPPLAHPAREAGGPRFYLAYHGANDRAAQERLGRLVPQGLPWPPLGGAALPGGSPAP